MDGDYCYIDGAGGSFGPARWHITGLSEPDCLYCHVADPTWAGGVNTDRYDRRGAALRARENLVDDVGAPVPAFAAAGVAGQGWFSSIPAAGSVATSLQIDYSVGLDHNVPIAGTGWGCDEYGNWACGDCHEFHNGGQPTVVMDRLILVDPFGPDGQPVYETVEAMNNLDPG